MANTAGDYREILYLKDQEKNAIKKEPLSL